MTDPLHDSRNPNHGRSGGLRSQPGTESLPERLRSACDGHPHAKIEWPHRILHEAADRIEELTKALQFYADARRYQGANQNPIPNDPYAKPDAAYIMDVTRDGGATAYRALRVPLERSGGAT